MAEELPLFLGLNDKTVTDIPKTVEKQRYMTSVAPKAANPGKWVEKPRLPIPTGEHAVIECQGKIHSSPAMPNIASTRISIRSTIPRRQDLVAEGALPAPVQSRRRRFDRHENLHLRRLRRAEPLPAFQVLRLRHRHRPMGADRADLAPARRHLGDRARRQDPSARRPRRALGRMARDLRSGDRQIHRPRRHARLDRHAAFRRPARPHGRRRRRRQNPRHRRPHGQLRFQHRPERRLRSEDRLLVLPRAAADAAQRARRASISTARSWCSAAKRPARCSAPTRPTIRRPTAGSTGTPMAIPRHGLHGATCAVIGNMVHVPGGGPVPGGQVQGAYHDAFTFG